VHFSNYIQTGFTVGPVLSSRISSGQGETTGEKLLLARNPLPGDSVLSTWAGLQGAHRGVRLTFGRWDFRAAFSQPNPREAPRGLTKDKALLLSRQSSFYYSKEA